jgi:Putative peptidoglycan binding domain
MDAPVFTADVRVRSTKVPGTRLVLLAIVFAIALIAAPPAPASTGDAGPTSSAVESPVPVPAATAFDRQGMWIWYVDRTEGGDLARIAARAKRSGIGTLYIKSGDGGDYWSQFNSAMVQRLHAAGLSVCAWAFVYGDSPVAEARVSATAVKRGADCFVIDAEGNYEGKYAAADRYMRALRARIGDEYPVALAGFPYVDYHPSFPYSVFFGPGGATFNQPQMYWKAIGTSVRGIYEHTYLFNRLWGHPLYPLGQTYMQPGRKEIIRFRRFAENYGGQQVSWWAWHETTARSWNALGARLVGPVFGYRPISTNPVLKRGSSGDLVVWAQMHLRAAGRSGLPITGVYGRLTTAAVRAFQADRALPADGVIGQSTWRQLLTFEPVRPLWAGRRAKQGQGAAASRATSPRRPLSASLPARAYEIDPGPAP